MLADPTVLTINGVAKSLVRVNQDGYSSEYLLREALGEYRLKVRNTPAAFNKRLGVTMERHNVELTHTLYPVLPATVGVTRKVYLTIENQQGDTLVDPMYETAALCVWLTANSSANVTKMLNSES